LFKGRLRVADRDDRDLDGSVELRVLLPDRFLRVDTIGSTRRRTQNRSEFARLMLGIAAYPAYSSELTIRSTGEEAFPETIALDISAKGFSARFVVDSTSYVPLRLAYFGEKSASTVVSFAGRRPEGGLDLPHRIAVRTMQRVLETLMFDEIV